jgi:hypothetical protein
MELKCVTRWTYFNSKSEFPSLYLLNKRTEKKTSMLLYTIEIILKDYSRKKEMKYEFIY